MTGAEITVFILFPVAGYFLGAVPFAWVIGKAHGVDIRTTGSKNIGATNLGRTLGPKYFWQAFCLDALKGFLPVLAVSLMATHFRAINHELFLKQIDPGNVSAYARLQFYLTPFDSRSLPRNLPSWAPLITAAACFLGHVFPVYLKFKGGKGVATSFGVVLGFWPLYTIAGLIGGLFFVFMLMVYRYISLASMTASLVFVGFVALLASKSPPFVDTYVPVADRIPLIGVAGFFSLVIIFRHRANIGRLLKGTESKIGQREIDKAKLTGHDVPQDPSGPPAE